MANLTTVSDIRADVLFRGGENPTDSNGKFYAKIIEYINRANLDLHLGKGPLDPNSHANFKWAIAANPKVIILQPKITTDSVSLTNNVNTVTFSATIATSVAGYFLLIDGHPDRYKVLSHTAGTAVAVLDSVYTGDTDADATFKLISTQYSIGSSDILRMVSPMNIYRGTETGREYKIYEIDHARFDEQYPLGLIQSGVPFVYKVVSVLSNNITVQFNRYSDTDLVRVECPYIGLPTDLTSTDTPIVPREYRYVLADWALAFLLQDKNDNRNIAAFQLAQAGFQAMTRDLRYSFSDTDKLYAQIVARRDDMVTDRDNVLRTESGLVIG